MTAASRWPPGLAGHEPAALQVGMVLCSAWWYHLSSPRNCSSHYHDRSRPKSLNWLALLGVPRLVALAVSS